MYTTISVILFNVVVMAIDRDCDFIAEAERCCSCALQLMLQSMLQCVAEYVAVCCRVLQCNLVQSGGDGDGSTLR